MVNGKSYNISFNFLIPIDLHEKVKLLAFEKQVSMSKVCVEAIQDYIRKEEPREVLDGQPN